MSIEQKKHGEDPLKVPLANSLIDQVIREYKLGETMAYGLAITLVLVGICAIAYGAWKQEGAVALAGGVATSLFIPALHYASRIRREKAALRLLKLPLSMDGESKSQGVDAILCVFREAFAAPKAK